MYNNVQVLRAVDRCITESESKATGRKRSVLVHGNRYLLHKILSGLSDIDGYATQYLKASEISTRVGEVFNEVWENVYMSMEKHFSESYPVHIFKNAGRLRTLES